MLSTEEKRQYIRQLMLPEVGVEGQTRIRKAKIAVVGAGGLGCPVLLYLAAAGVGTLGIIDFDVVDLTNLHRQILYGVNDVGQKKALKAAEKLAQLHPSTQFNIHDVMLNESNVSALLDAYDLVIDGCDNFLTRYTVNDACVQLQKPLVYGSILGFEGQVAVFNVNGSKNLRNIFPEPPHAEDVPDCSENGVLATVPGIVGTYMANEALKVILGQPALTNQYLVLDLLHHQQRKISF
jgi:adenylyltransferase/sulfurtransferase